MIVEDKKLGMIEIIPEVLSDDKYQRCTVYFIEIPIVYTMPIIVVGYITKEKKDINGVQ